MKVAIGFYGITRSLKFTIESIRTKIFDVLKENNISYDVFIHTYRLTQFKNERTRECVKCNEIDNEEYKLLHANYEQIDDQDKIKEQLHLSKYRSCRDPWKTKYNSVDNFILGQFSKYNLTKMIEATKNTYDYILFMRPDCLYLDSFSIDFFNFVNDTSIVIPNFHLFGPYNFNDRFCIANMNTYKIYGEVFTQLLDISKKEPLHSETVIGKIFENNHITVSRVKFNFSRVRYFGRIQDSF